MTRVANLASTSPADEFASSVAHDLQSVEHALDDVLARSGAMLQNLAEGRRAAGLGAAIGQHALVSLGAAVAGAIATRGEVVTAHRRFERDARTHGLNYALFGPTEPKEPDTPDTPKPIGRLLPTT